MSPMSPAAASMPPLPNLSGGAPAQAAGGGQDPMAALVSGIAPVKSAVDAILQACKSIVQSGSVPGAEQPCGQIVALATSLLPMAVQQLMQPSGGPIGPVGQGQPGQM